MSKAFRIILSISIATFGVLSVWAFKISSLSSPDSSITSVKRDNNFNAYWYADKAEIRTYNLTQSRYGELHKGRATVIFVAQPFLKKKGVKPDIYRNTSDQILVLKMNLLKKFGTGIYPYSMMLSTFTQLNENVGLTKASVSGQEWCGHIFSQMNSRKDHYDVVSYSYLEEEGDTQFELPKIFTEDEIWSRIRIDYKNLPQGEISIIPGLYYTRLEQHQFKKEKANGSLDIKDEESSYTLTYPKRERTLKIIFNTSFPHEIIRWEETYADKRAPDKKLTTTAVLDKSKNIDYWNYNAKKYQNLRQELGVPY